MRVLPKTRCRTNIGERTRRDRDGVSPKPIRAYSEAGFAPRRVIMPHLARLRNNYSVGAGRAGVSLSGVDR